MSKWLRKTVESAGAKGVVYGLSGGIDSAVVGAISKMAFGDKSLGLMLPCHSDPQDLKDGRLVAESLGLKTDIVDLGPAYDELIKNSIIDSNLDARSNLKPRLRTSCLYYYGQTLSYMVLGGTNKSEYFIGYFTKYGDSGVDIMPIADFTKTEIYKLARVLNIPDKIINKPPSAGLFEGQTDEDDLGFSYEYLDDKIINDSWDSSNLDQRILKLHENSKHKYQPPIIYRKEEE